MPKKYIFSIISRINITQSPPYRKTEKPFYTASLSNPIILFCYHLIKSFFSIIKIYRIKILFLFFLLFFYFYLYTLSYATIHTALFFFILLNLIYRYIISAKNLWLLIFSTKNYCFIEGNCQQQHHEEPHHLRDNILFPNHTT